MQHQTQIKLWINEAQSIKGVADLDSKCQFRVQNNTKHLVIVYGTKKYTTVIIIKELGTKNPTDAQNLDSQGTNGYNGNA